MDTFFVDTKGKLDSSQNRIKSSTSCKKDLPKWYIKAIAQSSNVNGSEHLLLQKSLHLLPVFKKAIKQQNPAFLQIQFLDKKHIFIGVDKLRCISIFSVGNCELDIVQKMKLHAFKDPRFCVTNNGNEIIVSGGLRYALGINVETAKVCKIHLRSSHGDFVSSNLIASSDSKFVIISMTYLEALVLCSNTKQVIKQIVLPARVVAFALSTHEDFVYFACSNRMIYVYDMQRDEFLKSWQVPGLDVITCLEYCSDYSVLAVG